jgi:hypothetical protein
MFVLHALIELYFSFGKKKYFVHLLIFGKRSTLFGEQSCGKNYKEVKLRFRVS